MGDHNEAELIEDKEPEQWKRVEEEPLPDYSKAQQITAEYDFAAAHILKYHKGKCNNLHGHNYKVEVTIVGEPSDVLGPGYGMILDYYELDKLVDPLIDILDHSGKLIEDIIQEESTAENISRWLVGEIYERMLLTRVAEAMDDRLHTISVKVWETPKHSAATTIRVSTYRLQ